MSGRRPFTDKEDSFLVQYIAKYCPEDKGRSGQKIYQTLVENSRGVWPWAKSHSAQSWRERYLRKREEFDRRIKKWQAKHLPAPDDTDFGPRSSFAGAYNVPQTPSGQAREPFTTIDDLLLVKYLAIETPDGAHRKGNAVYRHLVSLPDKWPWGTRHTALSWLERYRKRSEIFDAQIRDYQDKHGIQRVGKVRHELWDKLPRISSEHAQPPQHVKHEGKPKAEPAPQKRKKRPVVDEGDEEDEETDGERRKRRRLEKRKAVEVSEDEWEGEGEEAATPVPRQKKKIIRAVSEAQTGTSEHDAADAERLLHEGSLEPQQIADVDDWDAPFPPIEEAIQSKPQKDIGPTQESPYRHGVAGAATQESYVVPSPETLKRSSARAPAPKISQEPTPPTSDAAHSPRLHTRKHPSPLSHESEKPAASSSRHPDSVHGSPTSQREDGEEEFEAAAPAAQSSVPRRRQPAHHPPKRIEGAFNSAFARSNGTRSYKGARRVSGVDDTTGSDSEAEAESAKDWPPKRGTGKGKVGVAPSVTGQDDAAGSNVLEKDTIGSPARGNVASRSTASPVKNITRRTLSPSHHEARTETRPPRSYSHSHSHSTSRMSPQKSAKFADEEIVTPRPRAKVTVVEDQPVAGPSRLEPAITDTAERRHTLATPAAAHRRVQRLKAKARHSMPAYRTRRSSVGPIVSNLSYHGRFITAEDYQHIFEFGIRGILKEIASSTGFTFEVVENVWGLCGTIADTKAMLNRMREKAQKEAGEAYEALDIEEKVQERERAVLEDRHAERVELSVAVGVSGSRMFASSVRRAGVDEGEYWPPEDSKAAILLQQRMEQEEDSEDDEQPGDFLTQEVDAEEQGKGRTNEKDDEEIEDELSEGEPGEKEEEAEEEEETVYMLSQDIEVEEDEQEREGMDMGEVVGEGVENEQENDDEERMAKDREGSIPSEDEDEDADDSYDQEHESLYGNINHILQQVKFGKRQ